MLPFGSPAVHLWTVCTLYGMRRLGLARSSIQWHGFYPRCFRTRYIHCMFKMFGDDECDHSFSPVALHINYVSSGCCFTLCERQSSTKTKNLVLLFRGKGIRQQWSLLTCCMVGCHWHSFQLEEHKTMFLLKVYSLEVSRSGMLHNCIMAAEAELLWRPTPTNRGPMHQKRFFSWCIEINFDFAYINAWSTNPAYYRFTGRCLS
jgi:hypothetical protein